MINTSYTVECYSNLVGLANVGSFIDHQADRIFVTSIPLVTGVNADLWYSIVKGNEKNTFSLGRSTGMVNLVGKLDYETK